MQRVTAADYREYKEGTFVTPIYQKLGLYNENALEYDVAGNITKLKRNGYDPFSGTINGVDDLILEYAGHQLIKATDLTNKSFGFADRAVLDRNEYNYDPNGNLRGCWVV